MKNKSGFTPLEKLNNKKRCTSLSGFTIIETIIVIIILGITLTPFAILVVTVMQKNVYSQAQATAVSLAEGEFERVMGTRFSLLANEAQAAFSAPFANYTHEVVVAYVNPLPPDTSNYKSVEIRINNVISGTIKLVSLVANDW